MSAQHEGSRQKASDFLSWTSLIRLPLKDAAHFMVDLPISIKLPQQLAC